MSIPMGHASETGNPKYYRDRNRRDTIHVSVRKTTVAERKKWHGGPAPAVLPHPDKSWRPKTILF